MCIEYEEKEKIRKVFLDDLPKLKNGRHKGHINWKNSIGCNVNFIYDSIQGVVEIIEYTPYHHKLTLKYLHNTIYKISTSEFIKCKLAGLLKEDLLRPIYNNNNPRRVDLRGLPIIAQGIDWNKVAEDKMKLPFVYDDIKGEIEILNYNKRYLTVKYLDKEPFKILTGNFQKCKLGKLLGKITGEFKTEIGKRFIDDKRDLVIIDREYRTKERKDEKNEKQKWYKYRCNKCGYEGWVIEGSLLGQTEGCPVCCVSPNIIVSEINSIVAKEEAQWMIPYFQGGYDEAKLYAPQSNQKIRPICPDCGRVGSKDVKVFKIYRNHSIGCSCGDGKSYPEKLMFNILEQLEINFETEYSPNWCKYEYKDKLRQGRYDFYFELINKKYIVETDGGFHKNKNTMNGQTAEKSQRIDNYKDRLANEHGIEVIRIDCEKSELEYIKDNILNSRLNELFDLSNINWIKAEEFALSNLVKKVCEIKRGNPELSTMDIADIIKMSQTSIIKYLKQGNKVGWVQYNKTEEFARGNIKTRKALSKKVEIFKDNISIGIFNSVSELDEKSEKYFGKKLDFRAISSVCLGKIKTHKGFTFKYVEIDNLKKAKNTVLQ